MLKIVCIVAGAIALTSAFLENNKDRARKVYEFDFELTWEQNLVYTDPAGELKRVNLDESGNIVYYDDMQNTIYVNKSDVVTLDGRRKKFLAINGQYIGPTIRVTQGSTVYVHVTNSLITDAATLHWHGLDMKNTQWSDGVPYVTQCPIQPGAKFTYKFHCDKAGTFWYHSHMDLQRMDGLFGALIVDGEDYVPSSYNDHTLLVNDFILPDSKQAALGTALLGGDDSTASFTALPTRYSRYDDPEVESFPFDSMLTNGRGRYQNSTAPLEITYIDENKESRLRVVNVAYDKLFELSIDGHQLEIVEVDSCQIEPIVVDTVYLAVGERITLNLKRVDQSAESYWIRYKGVHLMETLFGTSIITYNISNTADPQSSNRKCTKTNPCLSFNCPFPSNGERSCIRMDQVNATKEYQTDIDKIRSGDYETERFFAYSYMVGDNISGRKLALTSTHMYQSGWTGVPCIQAECNTVGCDCTNIHKLPYQASVQIVVMHQVLKHFVHTFHMHGHRFAVVRVVFPPVDNNGYLTKQKDINCTNDLCHTAWWVNAGSGNFIVTGNPPLKDTVMIPLGGYVVLRVFTDNPGYWMAHCHQTIHLHEGMALIFDVSGKDVSIPKDFPTCGNFKLSPPENTNKGGKTDSQWANVGFCLLLCLGLKYQSSQWN